ncbi:MAG: M23 family metallopeptidase [Bacteroidetes bacterium]|nr:MAG: M23 family metallopeptidase [Bacteroidota bacterium]TAG87668.1 MAG: M23 family metallopeptidase [Bacteroidota bacterium]
MNTKKYFILIILMSLSFLILAQKSEIVTTEKEGNIIHFHFNNPNPYPISVLLDFTELKNMTANKQIPFKVVLKANQSREKVITITPKNKNSHSYRYTFKTMNGDCNKKHNEKYAYRLPFEKGSKFRVMQGFFGTFSHQKQHAIDFDMPIGTKIVAAREGIVIQTKDDSNKRGTTKEFAEDGNYIRILHNDGTTASYFHLRKNGVEVKVGDEVEKGQFIGYSGNTGWSTAPHLHFVIYQNSFEKAETVPFLFETSPKKLEEVKKDKFYTAF